MSQGALQHPSALISKAPTNLKSRQISSQDDAMNSIMYYTSLIGMMITGLLYELNGLLMIVKSRDSQDYQEGLTRLLICPVIIAVIYCWTKLKKHILNSTNDLTNR